MGAWTIHMRSEGTSLLLGSDDTAIPVVRYWGPDLGSLSRGVLEHVSLATARMEVDNDPDVVLAPGLIPGGWTGWTGRPGVVGHRLDGSGWSPRLGVVGMRYEPSIGGDTAMRELAMVDAELGPGSLELALADTERALSAVITMRLGPGGTIQVSAALRNEGNTPYQLDELNVALPVPLEMDEVLDCTGRWGRERMPQRSTVTFGAHVREGRHGRTGFDSPTLMVCGRAGFAFASGEVRALHVAASGNHRTYVERLPEGHQVLGGGELLHPGEVLLAPGETYRGPELHYVHGDGLDDAANRVHKWVRSLAAHPDSRRPVTLNVWEAVHFDHRLPRLLELADVAARLGVERYVLDDGWFGARRDDRAGLGDWTVSREAWPEGLTPLTDHVTELGMQFGLWFEPEMVNPVSETARAHPDWILKSGDDLPVEWRHQQVLDLTNPAAWNHVHEQIEELLCKYPITYIKWDHNRDVFDAGSPTMLGRAAVGRQTRAALALMDRLRSDHPDLEIESCSSGGGRIDLEMVRHVQRFWVSDCIDPHERHSIVRWTEQIVPLEMLGTHVASGRNQTTGREHDLSFRAGTALWGHLGIEWDLTVAGEEELEELARWINFYKSQRDLLFSGRLVRDVVGDDSAWLHGVIAPDGGRALYEYCVLDRGPMTTQGPIRLLGLNDEDEYQVRVVIVGSSPSGLIRPPWFGISGEGVRGTGVTLRQVGIEAPVLHPDQAILIEALRIGTSMDADGIRQDGNLRC